MISALALAAGLLVGFVGSRALRRRGGVGGGGRSAPELQRACFDAAVRHVRRDSQGRATLPTSFRFALHPDDLATVDDARGWFTDELASALADAAEANRWQLAGPVQIDLVADPSRRRGAPSALAIAPATTSAPATSRGRPPAPAPARQATPRPRRVDLELVRVDTGERWALDAAEIRVGRTAACDLTIDDKRVSRHHATLRRGSSGWTVTDEGSANGTSVNGRRLAPGDAAALAAGDTVALGPIGLELRPARGAGR